MKQIVRETVASLVQHAMAPSIPLSSTSFSVCPLPADVAMEDLSPSASSFDHHEVILPPQKHDDNYGLMLMPGSTSAASALAASSYTNPTPSSTLTSFPVPGPGAPSFPLQTRSITLAGGVRLTFNENEVPTAPSLSFARNLKRDLPLLNAMWDDHTVHWAGASFLDIKGHPIPLVYWKKVYTAKQGNGWKLGQWKRIKGNYFDWKVSIVIHTNTLLTSWHPRFLSRGGESVCLKTSGLSFPKQGNRWDTSPSLPG
jgi:hypothetical protein